MNPCLGQYLMLRTLEGAKYVSQSMPLNAAYLSKGEFVLSCGLQEIDDRYASNIHRVC